VAILPFIEEDQLYREFRLDEPWDSEHNRRLLSRMPKLFAIPGHGDRDPTRTHYQAVVGPQTMWEATTPSPNAPFGAKGQTLQGVNDGTSMTILVIESQDSVPWTKPEDAPFDGRTLPKLGGLFSAGAHVCMTDGRVHFVRNGINSTLLRAAMTRNGGETLPNDWYGPSGDTPATFNEVKGSAIDPVAEARNRVTVTNKMRQLAFAAVVYADAHLNRLPPAAICDKKTGKPLLSWRVAILPQLGHEALFKEFKLDEPWDSTHNQKLLARMPKEFDAEGPPLPEKYTTLFQAVVGRGAAWEFTPDAAAEFGAIGMRYPIDFPDGTSNTILLIEAASAIPWTKPEDVPVTATIETLGGQSRTGFHVALADGSTKFVPRTMRPATFRSALTRNGGEIMGGDW
jgi:hypothetical protein